MHVFHILLNLTNITLTKAEEMGEARGGREYKTGHFGKSFTFNEEREDQKEKELSTRQAFLAELSAWVQTPSAPASCAVSIVPPVLKITQSLFKDVFSCLTIFFIMKSCEIKTSCVLVLLENWSDVTRNVNAQLGAWYEVLVGYKSTQALSISI